MGSIRYAVFAWPECRNAGGWCDLVGQFHTLDEALGAALPTGADCGHIIDTFTGAWIYELEGVPVHWVRSDER